MALGESASSLLAKGFSENGCLVSISKLLCNTICRIIAKLCEMFASNPFEGYESICMENTGFALPHGIQQSRLLGLTGTGLQSGNKL